MTEGVTCPTCKRMRSPRLALCPSCRGPGAGQFAWNATAEGSGSAAAPPSPARKATITVAFIAGLGFVGVQLFGDADPMPLGPPIPSFIAAGLALVVAAAMTAPAVRWLGGKDAVDTIVKRDAALPAPDSALFAASMARTAREGMSSRDQRILLGFLLFFPLLAAFLTFADLANRSLVSEPTSIDCRLAKQARNPESQRVEAWFSCTLPSGEAQRATGFFDAELTQTEGPVPARRGALGIWLLPKSSVRAEMVPVE
jgi:hypothetical protein